MSSSFVTEAEVCSGCCCLLLLRHRVYGRHVLERIDISDKQGQRHSTHTIAF